MNARTTVALLLACALGCSDPPSSPDAAVDDAGPVADSGPGRDGGPGGTDAGPRADGGPDADGGPGSFCGDLTCDPDEACDACVADCGECEEPPVTECNDGIDNDGDGLVDWQMDVGCWSAADGTEASGDLAAESGWTTFDLDPDSRIIYVSASEGDDGNDGLTPASAVATPERGAELVRDGFPDFLLFRRGDTWRGRTLGSDRVRRRFKSGRDADHPLVIGSYGDSIERPRFEVDQHFLDHDGNERSFVAVVGLAFISYRKDPSDAEFNGADGGALRLIGTGSDVLVEDNYVEYGELIVQNETDVTLRRNVVYRSYHVGTCAYRADGSRDPNGDRTYRPSGVFAGRVDGLVIEENVWDENGWNPDVAEACATIYNHDLYLSGNDRVVVRDNLILRASSIGLKMAANETGASNGIVIENNLFAEGEIGISMGGNADTPYRFTDAQVLDNVFTDIGRSQPTTRELSWYIDVIDNDGVTVRGNLLVNQPDLGNPRGIHLTGGTNRGVTIEDNLLHGLRRRLLNVNAESGWATVAVTGNTLVQEGSAACLVSHDGGFGGFAYGSNAYLSGAAAGEWFCVDGARRTLAEWMGDASESGATTASVSPPDPTRNLDAYAAHLSLGTTLADFAAAARLQSRHRYRPELMAPAANAYIREGFGVTR